LSTCRRDPTQTQLVRASSALCQTARIRSASHFGCVRAQLQYQFDDSDIAAAFRGLGGSQILSRIGGCE